MTVASVQSGTPLKRRRTLGAASIVLLIVGSVGTLVSFATLSWFTVSGPNVITGTGQGQVSSTEPKLLVSPDQGTHHSAVMWAVVVVCVLAAIAVQLSRVRLASMWMAVTVVLAAIGLLNAIGRVSITKLAVGESELPSGTTINVQVGAWIAIASLVLVALSAVMAQTSQSAVTAS